MKIRMLVGACGLALTGTAMAGTPMHSKFDTSKVVPADQIAAHREMRSEVAQGLAPKRSLLTNGARGGFVYRDTFDDFDADNMAPQDGPGIYIVQTDLTEPSTYEGPFSLAGQENPDGQAWQSVPFGGIVTQAVALSDMDGDPGNGEYNGPVAGPDPMGVRGGMLNVQRSSVNDPSVDGGAGIETYEFFTDLYVGAAGAPLFFEIDCYKPNHETFQWVRPISYTQGLFVSGILMGGYNDSGLFLPLAQMHDDPNLIEGAVILANVAGDPDSGEFVINPKRIPEGDWFTLGLMIDQTINGMQIMVRDSQTLADANMDGDPDWQMPVKVGESPTNPMAPRMFEEFGYGIEMGWASILPGTVDAPSTPDIIEGAGYARNGDNEVTDRFFGADGNDWASIFAGISLDASRLYHGSDPSTAQVPGYVIEDWWWDDIRIRGVPFPQPDPIPTYRIPYIDDMERWNVGPLGLQGGRWTEASDARTQVVDNQNNTPDPGSGSGPTAEQSLRLQNTLQTDVFDNMMTTNLPTTPRVRGEVGDPAIVSAAMRFQSTFLSYGVDPIQAGLAVSVAGGNQPDGEDILESMARVFTSGTDALGQGDGLMYVRQRKPIGTDIENGEFDPNDELGLAAGPHLTPDQEEDINTEYINVLAAPAGMADFSLSTNDWHVIEMRGEPRDDMPRGTADNGETEIVRIFVSVDGDPFVELHPNGNAAESWTTNAIAPTDVRFSSSNGFLAGFVNLWVDDIALSGPTQTDTLVPLSTEFSDDPAWELDMMGMFSDSLDTYEKGRPATPQGFANHRLGFMPIGDPDVNPIPDDVDEIEFIDGAAALTVGEAVRVYEIISIDQGTPGFNVGDIVAVRDDVLSTYDPDANDYGVANTGEVEDATDWYILDSLGGSEVARGTWFLATETGATTFVDDGSMEDMGARYSYRQNWRYTGSERESEFVSAADEGIDTARGSRGDIVKLTNKANIRDYSPNSTFRDNTVNMFNGFFPVAQTAASSDEASISFDFYVGQSAFNTGFIASFPGGTADGGAITSLGFGGMGFASGNRVDGITPRLDTGNFSTLVPNPVPAAGEPENIWMDSGVAVPTNTWFTVSMTVNGDSEYSIAINGSEIASGVAIDATDPAANTNSLDSVNFFRNQWGENDGEPVEGVVQWSARNFDAPAPATGGVGTYHFFQIVNEIIPAPGESVPQIWPVDSATGDAAMDMMMMPATRTLQATDWVAILNVDPASMTMDGFPSPLVNDRYQIVSDDARGITLIANGTWEPRGLPGADGAGSNQAPAGGLTAGATPDSSGRGYNADPPYRTILLGDYVNVEGTTVLPSDTWYVDNFKVSLVGVTPCPANLDGSGDNVNSGDLAVLLAAWGNSGGPEDLDGSGTVGSGDLAVLLAAWGACP